MTPTVKIIVATIAILAAIDFSEGGSPCPLREAIHPCYCTSVTLTKRTTFTIVTCRHVTDTNSLARIYSTLRGMSIDRFILYDSFWGLEGADSENHKKLPQNWISTLKISDFEIIDTDLSHSFACDISFGCPNTIIKQLTISNSSSSDIIVSRCPINNNAFTHWTECLERLQQFSFINNKLYNFTDRVFPGMMNHLVTLNLSRNSIETIGSKAFKNFPKLYSLDLSHNRIMTLSYDIFGDNSIANLDLSYNFLRTLDGKFLQKLPDLEMLFLSSNKFDTLPEKSWNGLSQKIKILDFNDNPLTCSCDLIWMNCTLKVHVNILGSCLEEEYQDKTLRKVAIYMSKVCDENGNISPLVNQTRNSCLDKKRTATNMLVANENSRFSVANMQDENQRRRHRNRRS